MTFFKENSCYEWVKRSLLTKCFRSLFDKRCVVLYCMFIDRIWYKIIADTRNHIVKQNSTEIARRLNIIKKVVIKKGI